MKEDIVLWRELGIDLNGIYFDSEIAGYLLNSSISHYTLEELSKQYLKIEINSYLEAAGMKQEQEKQMTLFAQETDTSLDFERYQNAMYVYTIAKLQEVMIPKLEEINAMELFQNIEIPLVKVLANMQYEGIYLDK